MVNLETRICLTCGNHFSGKYCNQCGEKVYDVHDKTFKHLFEEIFHFFTHFDGKFLRTLKLVLLKTGTVSVQYCNGIRKPFFKPISLFFICVIAYLLFPVFGGLNMKLGTYVSPESGYASISRGVIKQKMQKQQVSFLQLSDKYNTTSPKFAKVFILLFLPLSALVLNLLFFNSRKYFFDHFILATELNTFFVFVGYLFLPVIMMGLLLINHGFERFFKDGSWLYKSVTVLYLLITTLAFHRFYKQGWLWSFIKATLFILLFTFVIRFAYHAILFWVVMFFI